MNGWNPMQYEIDAARRADALHAAEERRLLDDPSAPEGGLRRALSGALYELGGTLVAGGSALQRSAKALSANLRDLHSDEEAAAPERRRHAGGY